MRIDITKAQVIRIGNECFVKVSSIRDAVDFEDHIAITLKRGTVAIHMKDDRDTKVYKADATEYVPHDVKEITLRADSIAGRTTHIRSQRPIGFNTERNTDVND